MHSKIYIQQSDANTGKLRLSDGGTTIVDSDASYNDRKVEWIIDTEDVKSFKIVGKPSAHPFVDAPGSSYGETQVVRVKKRNNYFDWDYTILWIDQGNKHHRYDPKISVLPSKRNSTKKFLVRLFIGLIAAFGLGLVFQKRRKFKN
jgi:hypothetical protein